MTYKNGTALEYKGYTLTKNKFGWRITNKDGYFGYGGTLKAAREVVDRKVCFFNIDVAK